MSEPDKTGDVYRALGRYFCVFSKVEHELGEAVKVIFRLQNHEGADAIVACLGDISRKLNLVRSGIIFARKPDGSETEPAWRSASEKMLTRIHTINTQERVLLAHSYLEPQATGTLKMTRLTSQGELKITPHEWTDIQIDQKSNELEKLATEVRRITEVLDTLTITVDITLANLTLDASGTVIPIAGTHPSEPPSQ
jgi:hypothetical protein